MAAPAKLIFPIPCMSTMYIALSIFYFFSSGGGGGGGILKLSGWVGAPDPTCSHGDAASWKFLPVSERVRWCSPKGLGKLQWFVNDSLLLLVIPDL